MATDTKLKELIINKLTTSQYDSIEEKDPNQLYIVTDAPSFDDTPHIVETYKNGPSWYRVYSDGWIEQGGRTSTTANPTTINYLKSYTQSNPTVLITITGVTAVGNYTGRIAPDSTTSFQIQTAGSGNTNVTGIGFVWYACGY